MWPFKRTLSERYSKLVKLIKSIDSHFQITDKNEDTLCLHSPNYKGCLLMWANSENTSCVSNDSTGFFWFHSKI